MLASDSGFFAFVSSPAVFGSHTYWWIQRFRRMFMSNSSFMDPTASRAMTFR